MVVQALLIDRGRWVWLPISSLHPVNALALAFLAYALTFVAALVALAMAANYYLLDGLPTP